MARGSGINKNAIRKMVRDIQKEFDRNGPIRIPVEAGTPDLQSSAWESSDLGVASIDSTTIRLLVWLFERRSESPYGDVIEFAREIGLPDDRGRVLGEQLEGAGLADVAFDFGGGASARLTARGISQVEEVRRMRADRSLRARDLRRQMLNWLFSLEDNNVAPDSWDLFLEAEPSHLAGEPFSDSEVGRQATYLQEQSFITAVSIEEEEPGWLQPRLTSKGHDCVINHQGDVTSHMRQDHSAGGNVYYGPVIQGNANGAQLAWGNQTVNQTQAAQQIAPGFEALATAVADTLRQLPEFGLDQEDQADAEEVANEILAEVVTESPDRGKLRRACAALKGFLMPVITEASAGAGEGTRELVRQAIEGLNISG